MRYLLYWAKPIPLSSLKGCIGHDVYQPYCGFRIICAYCTHTKKEKNQHGVNPSGWLVLAAC